MIKKNEGINNSQKTQQNGINMQFYANLATILGVFIVLCIFFSNQCDQQKQEDEEYINQLEALKRELEINYFIRTNSLIDGEEGYLTGGTTPISRYYTQIINRLIEEGKIKNFVLRDKIYNIADRENNINRVLDGAFFTLHSLNLVNDANTQQGVTLRVIEDNKIAIANAKELYTMIPEVIILIEAHRAEIISNFNTHYPICGPITQ